MSKASKTRWRQRRQVWHRVTRHNKPWRGVMKDLKDRPIPPMWFSRFFDATLEPPEMDIELRRCARSVRKDH